MAKSWWSTIGFLGLLVSVVGGCDRNDLQDGPRSSGGSVTPPPPPPPPPGDCPEPPALGALGVKINEIMTQNTSTLEDERGEMPAGWIELYNTSDTEMDLRGVPLSDELGKPDKWTIPCVDAAKLPPHEMLIIFADGETLDEDDFHASFRLATSGTLQLILNKGSDLFFFDAGKLGFDQAAGRFPDGGAAISVLGEPTPGEPNAEPGGSTGPTEAIFVRADANQDGRVNITDMTAILGVLFQSGTAPGCKDRMDSNDDGAVNLTDVTYIGQALYQHGPGFPPPYPQEGKDPTADGLPCPAP